MPREANASGAEGDRVESAPRGCEAGWRIGERPNRHFIAPDVDRVACRCDRGAGPPWLGIIACRGGLVHLAQRREIALARLRHALADALFLVFLGSHRGLTSAASEPPPRPRDARETDSMPRTRIPFARMQKW